MIEIITEMALCLIIALVIGFVVGWLFKNALLSEKFQMNDDELKIKEDEYNRKIKILELQHEKEREARLNIERKNKELVFELKKKNTLLKNTTDILEKTQIKNNNINGKLKEFQKLLREKEKELSEFESVLIKAEQTIEKLKGDR